MFSKNGEKPLLVEPVTGTQLNQTTKMIYKQLARTQKFFSRGATIWEVRREEDGAFGLGQLDPGHFVNRLCEHFQTVRQSLDKRTQQLVNVEMIPSKSKAEIYMKAADVSILPTIQLILNAPVFTMENGKLEVLEEGHYPIRGGMQVVSAAKIDRKVPLSRAVNTLEKLLQDFRTATPADKGRILAAMMAPAFHYGKLLEADVPMFLFEADLSQTGKSYLANCICALYNEKPYVVVRRLGGVGSFDESINSALLSGRSFSIIENARGKVDSQVLEAILRGQDDVGLRAPHARETQTPRRGTIWMLTSNGVTLTDDLKNRTLPIQLRKQPREYEYHLYGRIPLLEHIRQTHDNLLSCIYAIAREWIDQGRRSTDVKEHDFREWTQSFDWIIQEIFGLPPLLEGVEAQLDRMVSAPKFKARIICQAIDRDGGLGKDLSLTQITAVIKRTGLNVPNRWAKSDAMELQGLLSTEVFGPLLPDADVKIQIDDYAILKRDVTINGKGRKRYVVTKV